MATIVSRKRGDGTTAHMARIIIKRKGKVIFRENRTFDRKQAAYAWADARETELNTPGGLDRALTGHVMLRDVIDKYVDTSRKEIGRTKAQVLKAIKAYPLADMECGEIGSTEIVSFATELGKDRKPQTVANYLSHLAAVFSIAQPAWGYPLDRHAVLDAMRVTKRLGITGKSAKRSRRPTLAELDQLLTYFHDRKQRAPQAMPMHVVIAFALFSTKRQEEITRIQWVDLDEQHKRVLVRDMKNPGEKIGNDVWCDLPDPALAIIQAMPRRKPEIFPYSTDAITANFTRACKLLGIEDLHFHDLRHEGISRLFELGLSIPHVAAVSGHRSWVSLKRYTHIRQSGDKYEGWKWLSVLARNDRACSHAVDSSDPDHLVVLKALDLATGQDELLPQPLEDDPNRLTRDQIRVMLQQAWQGADRPDRTTGKSLPKNSVQYKRATEAVHCNRDPILDTSLDDFDFLFSDTSKEGLDPFAGGSCD
jgi:integrase